MATGFETRWKDEIPRLRQIFREKYDEAYGQEYPDACVIIDAFSDYISDIGRFGDIQDCDLADLEDMFFDEMAGRSEE